MRMKFFNAPRIFAFSLFLIVSAFVVFLTQSFFTSAGVPHGNVPDLAASNGQLPHTSVSGSVVPSVEPVIVEPSEWIGKRLPLLDDLDIGRKVERGEWHILLVKSDCSDCMEEVKTFTKESSKLKSRRPEIHFACVDLSESASIKHFGTPIIIGRLGKKKNWLISTPLKLDLRDGIVRAIEGSHSSRVANTPMRPEPDNAFLVLADSTDAGSAPTRVLAPDVDLRAKSIHEPNGLCPRVSGLIQRYRQLCSLTDTPAWIRMHSILMFGETGWHAKRTYPLSDRFFDSILTGQSESGSPFSLRGQSLVANRGGEYRGEHHRDQFLSYLSLAGVPLDAPLWVDKQKFSVRDLLHTSQAEARLTGDVSCTICAYAHYLYPDDRWMNKFGEVITLGKLIHYALETPSDYCGGHHRLAAFARILARNELHTDTSIKPLLPRLRAELDAAVLGLRSGQTADGSLGVSPIIRDQVRGNEDFFLAGDKLSLAIVNNGHALDWIAMIHQRKQLEEEWVVRLVSKTTNDLSGILGPDADSSSKNDVRQPGNGRLFGAAMHAIAGLSRWLSKVEANATSH